MTDTIAHYHHHARALAAQYDALAFNAVHQSWLPRLTDVTAGQALDVGAGSGRDARGLQALGWQVTAVEPAAALRQLGQQHSQQPARWLDDQLPHLPVLAADAGRYQLILLSAVWMHLPAEQRAPALARLATLLADTGLLVISLRYGPSEPGRAMYPVSVDELAALAEPLGLQLELPDNQALAQDCLNRAKVRWQTVILQYRM